MFVLSDVSLQKNSTNEGSYLIVLEPMSVSVTVEVTPDLLNIMVLIGEDFLKGEMIESQSINNKQSGTGCSK